MEEKPLFVNLSSHNVQWVKTHTDLTYSYSPYYELGSFYSLILYSSNTELLVNPSWRSLSPCFSSEPLHYVTSATHNTTNPNDASHLANLHLFWAHGLFTWLSLPFSLVGGNFLLNTLWQPVGSCYPDCGSQGNGNRIIQELVRNAESQAPPQPAILHKNLHCNESPGWQWSMLEKHTGRFLRLCLVISWGLNSSVQAFMVRILFILCLLIPQCLTYN